MLLLLLLLLLLLQHRHLLLPLETNKELLVVKRIARGGRRRSAESAGGRREQPTLGRNLLQLRTGIEELRTPLIPIVLAHTLDVLGRKRNLVRLIERCHRWVLERDGARVGSDHRATAMLGRTGDDVCKVHPIVAVIVRCSS